MNKQVSQQYLAFIQISTFILSSCKCWVFLFIYFFWAKNVLVIFACGIYIVGIHKKIIIIFFLLQVLFWFVMLNIFFLKTNRFETKISNFKFKKFILFYKRLILLYLEILNLTPSYHLILTIHFNLSTYAQLRVYADLKKKND